MKKQVQNNTFKPNAEKFNQKLEELISSSVRKFRLINQKVIFLEMPDNKTWYIITDHIYYRLIEYERRNKHFVFKKLYNMYGTMHKASSPNISGTVRKFCVKLSKNLQNALETMVEPKQGEAKDFDHIMPISAIDNSDNLDKILTEQNEDVVLEENNNLSDIVSNLIQNGEISEEQLNQL